MNPDRLRKQIQASPSINGLLDSAIFLPVEWRITRRHYIHRLRLPAYAAENICIVVFLGLPTAESAQAGLAVGKRIHKPKVDFMTPSPFIYPISKEQPRTSLN